MRGSTASRGAQQVGSFLALEPAEMVRMPTRGWAWGTQLWAACLTSFSFPEVAQGGGRLFRETEMESAEIASRNPDSSVRDHTLGWSQLESLGTF